MEHGAVADLARLDVGWGRCREVSWGGQTAVSRDERSELFVSLKYGLC